MSTSAQAPRQWRQHTAPRRRTGRAAGRFGQQVPPSGATVGLWHWVRPFSVLKFAVVSFGMTM
ncbi:MAG: hypothetical protein WAN20_03060 [Pseudonocardiaceae bacterium]